MRKYITRSLLLAFLVVVATYVWFVNFNYRFTAVDGHKVYKSGTIPPDKIDGYLTAHAIKTVIDLRDPGVQDALNPANQAEIDAEAAAVAKLPGVRHINIPSPQVPTAKTLSRFFQVLDDPKSYPVLIHCYHGTGRAEIYSAIYRVEYEGWSDAAARAKTRVVVTFAGYHSAFADGQPKGDFLMHYKPRKFGRQSTLYRLEHPTDSATTTTPPVGASAKPPVSR